MKEIDTLFHDLDKPRSPIEMKAYLNFIQDTVHSNKELNEASLLKKGRFKKFKEEFYPLYLFSQSRFCPSASKVNIVLGNQGYDAIIESPSGEVRKLEITSYIEGDKDFRDGIRLIQRGYGETRLEGPKNLKEHQQDYLGQILRNIHKKGIRSYNDSSLLIAVNTFLYFRAFDLDDTLFVKHLMSEISKIPFQAQRVFLLIYNGNLYDPIDDHIYEIKRKN